MEKRLIIALNLLMALIVLFLHMMLMSMVHNGFGEVVAVSSLGVDRIGYNILTLSYPTIEEGGIIISVRIFDLTIPFILLLVTINVVLFIREKRAI
jgi:hypothetical protein